MGDFLMIGAVVEIIGGWRAAAFAALAVCAGSYASIQTVRLHHAQLVIAETAKLSAQAQADAQAKARAIEQAKAKAVAAVAESYERGKADAQATADRVAADLRAGTLRLRREWAGCETRGLSAASAATRELDAASDVRADLAGAAIRVGAECDAQVTALQAILRVM